MHSGTSDAFGGRGGRLGEPGYQGRIPDQSTPPGWRPNPQAFDPFNTYKGVNPVTGRPILPPTETPLPFCGGIVTGDPFTPDISGPRSKAKEVCQSWRRRYHARPPGDDSNSYASDASDTGGPAPDYDPVVSDASDTGSVDKFVVIDASGNVSDVPGVVSGIGVQEYVWVDGHLSVVAVRDGAIVGSVGVEADVTVVAPREAPSVPTDQPTSAVVHEAPPSIESLTEQILYRDLKESGYSSDALNRLLDHYENKFPLSGGNLRELLLKRSAAFATVYGGQRRQGDYLNAIHNAEVGLVDLAGATVAGGSWGETTWNLVKDILIGGALGATFGTLGGSSAASGAAGDSGGTLARKLDSALPPAASETSSLGEYQWGAPLRPSSANTQVYSGFPLRPNPPEIVIPRTDTPRVLNRAAEVGPDDLGHNFPSLLDPIIFTGPRYLRFGKNPFQSPRITYSSEGSLPTTVGRYEIGVIEDGILNEQIIHRSFTHKKIVLP